MSSIGTGATIAITIRAIDDFSGTIKKADTSLGGLAVTAGKVATAAIAATGVALTSLAVSSIKAAADFEQTQIAFETMLGSEEAGLDMLKQISDFAKKTPFTIGEVEEQTKKLLAYGIASEEVMGDIKTLGDIAAGVGTEKLPQLTLAFGQVATAGKLRGQEVRQFTEAGVPLLQALADTMGKTTTEIQEMTSAGEIGFEDVRKAMESLTTEGGRFEDLMAKQATTVQGKFSNLQDTFILIKRDLGTAFIPAISELADTFLNDLLPAVQPLIPVMTEVFMKILKSITPFLPQLIDGMMQFVDFTLELFDALTPLIEPLIEISMLLLRLFVDILKPFIPIIKSLADIFASLAPILLALEPIFNVIAKVIGFVVGLISTLVGWIAKLIELLVKLWSGSFGKVIQAIGGLFGGKSTTKVVDDAIIRPNGQIIETNPMDTLIATKNPEKLGSAGGGITIIIEGDNYGVDADSIAQSLASKINTQIRI